MNLSSLPSRRGAALVVVLSIVILVTLLVVGMTIAMRMDRSASHFHLERLRAEMFARSGVDRGIALLNTATDTNRFWVSGPGRIMASSPDTFAPLATNFTLSSGFATSTNTNEGTDLNRRTWGGATRLVDPSGTNLQLKWIYVQKDGTTTTTTNTNCVGRFAYWIDDENTRVNVNTAAARSGNPNAPASPSQISLAALPGVTDIASITNFAATNTFQSAMQALDVNPSLTNARFFLTAYSQDPEIDPWGRPKLVLTTQAARSLNRVFLDILAGAGDPGLFTNVSETKLRAVYTNIAASLARSDWPYGGSSSLAAKWTAPVAAQVALDVIEYVRTAEASNVWPQPLVVSGASTNTLDVLAPTTALNAIPNNALIGAVRRPLLSQVALFCSSVTNAAPGYDGKLYAQFYLPPGYGTEQIPDAYLYTEIETSPNGTGLATVTTPVGAVAFTNGYAVCAVPNFVVPASGAPTNAQVRLALLRANNPAITNILEVAPLTAADRISLPVVLDQTSAVWVNDPRRNKTGANWSVLSQNAGDQPPVINPWEFPAWPASDGSMDSVRFPAPGSVVGSVGELGFIRLGAPWRSIGLRPGTAATVNQLPDWAILDLFAAPIVSPASQVPHYLPATNAVAGRINLNALIRTTTDNRTRSNSLNALFLNVPSLPSLATAVSNVLTVTNMASQGVNFSGTNGMFLSPGQLAEIAGVAPTTEAGESVIRDVVSLATVRSGVFRIYSIGQALQVSPTGVMTVNGEKIVQVTVERYYDGDTPKWRTLSWSEIYP